MSTVFDADLVVLSHLRWDWVWQRPQQLISRVGRGRRTWFVEEPRLSDDVSAPAPRTCEQDGVTRLWFDTPRDTAHDEFGRDGGHLYLPLLKDLLGGADRDVWLYAPTATPLAEALAPRLLIYDVMDDLASFADAPPEMRLRMRRALTVADVAFAGGRSLHRSATSVRGSAPTHLFPSGVECDHYAVSRRLRQPRARKVAGYVGVLDERLDLDLIAGLADRLPHWDIHMVGPVTKIDPSVLPVADNIIYLGMQTYDRLPGVMADFDVALMPFALNDATRSISPTKTLEYLAAGLPVVSTRVPDVVADWSDVVHLVDDADQLAQACLHVATDSLEQRDRLVAPLRRKHEWNSIASAMVDVLQATLDAKQRPDESETA